MRIAVPTKANQVDDHFGHCEYFTIFELNENKEVIGRERLESSSECGCQSNLAELLAERKVDVMLAAGIGDGAIRKLNAQAIEVIPGFHGPVDEVVQNYLTNAIRPAFRICTDHHSCSGH